MPQDPVILLLDIYPKDYILLERYLLHLFIHFHCDSIYIFQKLETAVMFNSRQKDNENVYLLNGIITYLLKNKIMKFTVKCL